LEGNGDMDKNLGKSDILTPASKIASILREKIKQGGYAVGQRLDNERNLTKEFAASRGTIRQALDILTCERLIIRQQGRGTFVANPVYSPVQGNPALIGALVYAKEYFFGAILQSASSQSGDRGYMLTTGSNITKQTEKEHVDAFIKHSVKGVILAPRQLYSQEVYDQLIKADIPVVLLDTLLPNRNDDFVGVDNQAGTTMATEYLLSLGHKKLAYVGHNVIDDLPCQPDRLFGFMHTCIRNRIETPPNWIIKTDEDNYAEDIAQLFVQGEHPTAVVTYNDTWAARVINASRQAGLKIPEDVSIVGFDNSSIARDLDVSITSVNPEPYELGVSAINMLIDKIENPSSRPKRSLLIRPSLAIRQSTSEPPQD
jgi:GntR family transcriptional regulator, arabinose operon transcriptional repressor